MGAGSLPFRNHLKFKKMATLKNVVNATQCFICLLMFFAFWIVFCRVNLRRPGFLDSLGQIKGCKQAVESCSQVRKNCSGFLARASRHVLCISFVFCWSQIVYVQFLLVPDFLCPFFGHIFSMPICWPRMFYVYFCWSQIPHVQFFSPIRGGTGMLKKCHPQEKQGRE